MRRTLLPRFTLDVSHTRNQGPLPKASRTSGRNTMPGSGFIGHRQRDAQSSTFSSLLVVVYVGLLILVVMTGLGLALANPGLIRHPPPVIGGFVVGLFLLAFFAWLTVFVRRELREARERRRRSARREAASDASLES